MQSSFLTAEPKGSQHLTLEQVEKFYLELSILAYTANNRFSPLAKKVLSSFLHFLKSKFDHSSDLDNWSSRTKVALSQYVILLKSQQSFAGALDDSLLAAIHQDIIDDGKVIASRFDEDTTPNIFLLTLNDIRAEQQQKMTIVNPVFYFRIPTLAPLMHLYFSLENTLDSIIAQGDLYFATNKWSEAISIYLSGKRVLEITDSENYANINYYANKVLHKLGQSYLQFAKTCLTLDQSKASELLLLACEATDALEVSSDKTWINAQNELAQLSYNNAVELENTDVTYAIILLANAIGYMQNIANKYPSINILSMNELHHYNSKLGMLLLQKLLFDQTINHREKINLANIILTTLISIPDAVASCADFKNFVTTRKILALLSITFVTKNITVKTKIRYMNNALHENNLLELDPYLEVNIAHQKTFFQGLIDALVIVLPSLNIQQILKYSAILDNELSKIPMSAIEQETQNTHAVMKKSMAYRLNYLFSCKHAIMPYSFHALKKMQKQLRTIFNLLLLIDKHNISHLDRLNMSWLHQQYAYLGLESVLLDPKYASTDNLLFVRQMIYENNNKSLLSPYDFHLTTNQGHRQFAKLLLTYALKLRSDRKHAGEVINFLQSSIIALKKIPKLQRNEEDIATKDYIKKILQYAEAMKLCNLSLEQASTELNINRILFSINDIERLECDGFDDEDSWYINLLNFKYNNVMNYCQKHLDHKIDALAASFLKRPCFFSLEHQGHKDARELKKLFYEMVKPLKAHKCERLLAQALVQIQHYLKNSSLYEGCIIDIQSAIKPLVYLQINNLPGPETLARSQSMMVTRKGR